MGNNSNDNSNNNNANFINNGVVKVKQNKLKRVQEQARAMVSIASQFLEDLGNEGDLFA